MGEGSSYFGLDILLGKYFWLFIIGCIYLLFQNTITSAVDGLMMFWGRNFDEDDIVDVDGVPGRIVRVSLWKTIFYLYDVNPDETTVTGGKKLVVQNSQLKSMKISKPLPMLDLRHFQKPKTPSVT